MSDQNTSGGVFESFQTTIDEKAGDFREPQNRLLFEYKETPIHPERFFRRS